MEDTTDRGDVGDDSVSSFLFVVVGVDVDFSPCSDIMSGDASDTSVDEGGCLLFLIGIFFLLYVVTAAIAVVLLDRCSVFMLLLEC